MYKLRTLYNLIVVLMALYSFSNYSKAEDFFNTISKHTSGGVNIRLRDEYWDTFQKQNTNTDKIYNFFLIRARGWLDFKWDNLKIHVMGQSVKAFGLPENGAFGPVICYLVI